MSIGSTWMVTLRNVQHVSRRVASCTRHVLQTAYGAMLTPRMGSTRNMAIGAPLVATTAFGNTCSINHLPHVLEFLLVLPISGGVNSPPTQISKCARRDLRVEAAHGHGSWD